MAPIRCTNAPSTARSFLRLANRSSSFSTTSTASRPSGPLEFLVPRSTAQNPTLQRPLSSAENILLRRGCFTRLGCTTSGASRSFSVSAIQRATVCVENPVKDEDGKEMVLEITPRAAKRLSQIAAKDQNPNLALRITVESGGCHGFQYLMKLITLPERNTAEWSSIVGEDDTIFQFLEEGNESARIVLDEPSLDLLKGSKVDFTQELIGSQFKIVDNPYASSSCGCGTSFDIKP